MSQDNSKNENNAVEFVDVQGVKVETADAKSFLCEIAECQKEKGCGDKFIK